MAGITLRTARQVVPMIYAYTTPEIARHNGWTKIGYTEQSVDKRLKQQTHTADVLFHEEWRGNAVYDDGSGEVFTDHDFHAYLRKLNVENDHKNEWFHLDGQQSRRYFQDFRMNRGRVQLDAAIAYTLREEQARAVHDTKIYYQSHPGGEYLWNAKPRFGKTLSVYDFCKQVDAQTVLIVTNRPAIANSWYSDYVRFLGRESGYLFVSHGTNLFLPMLFEKSIYFKFNIRTVCRFLRLRRRKKAVVVDGLLINIVKKRNSWNAFVGITNEFIIADTFLNRGSIFVGCIMFYKAFDVVT